MRQTELERKTKETTIAVSIDLDGAGISQVDTGIGFFDHMLISLSRFACMDLEIKAEGDLKVDSHHTIEDCGIALGMAFKEALGDKSGIERVGESLLPMDEALVQVALDLSNRPYLVWDVDCLDGMIGEFPSEMGEEFFRALAAQAGITLHIRLITGKNRHHIMEAIFKGVGRALGKAVMINPRVRGILSTKGIL